MNKIKIGFIGTGYMANEYAKVLISKLPFQVTLVGAVNRSNHRIIDFIKKYKIKKRYNNISQLMKLAKPEIVIVAVNELSTFSVIKKLCQYPCHALIEKPIGINFDENKKITRLNKNKKFRAFVALNRRFYSSVIEARNILKNDNSKRVIKIHDQENQISALKSGQPVKVVKNWMYANSIHLIDFCEIFARGKLKKIVKNFNHKDYVSAILQYSSGDVVIYDCFWNRPAPWEVNISTGNYYIEMKPLENIRLLKLKNRTWYEIEKSNLDKKFKPGIYLQSCAMIDILNGKFKKKPLPLIEIHQSSKLMKVIRDIYFD